VLGQPRSGELPQQPTIGHRVLRGHDVADQTALTRPVLPDRHHRLANRFMCAKDRLDLAQLDAEPTHLHLRIGSPHEHQLTSGVPPHQIPRAIHPLALGGVSIGGQRAGHESLRGQPGPVRIATRQTRAGHVQLTGYPRRHRLQELIQHERTHVTDRSTHRW
jgi:hypothetical protein